jgi:hypothetical protein
MHASCGMEHEVMWFGGSELVLTGQDA